MRTSKIGFLAAGFFGLACLSGCGQRGTAVDEQLVSQHRQQLVLETEPDVVIGITELREQLEGTADAEADEHDGHDHDGPDHDEDDHDGHDEDGDDHAGHDEQGHDHDADEHGEHADHEHGDEEHGDEEHGDHEHEDHEHEDHDEAEHEQAEQLGSMAGIAVVGKISKETADGGASASEFPWEKGAAAFVMIDPAAEGDEAEHQHADGEECPFCAKKKIEAQAVVQFSADNGTIKVDARDLFDLKLDDIVVVRGDAALQGGVLIIDADGIFVRR